MSLSSHETIDYNHPETVYSIAHFQFGIAIRGSIPHEILSNFTEFFRRNYSYDTLDGLIANHIDASFVFTTKSKGKMWRKSLGIDEQ